MFTYTTISNILFCCLKDTVGTVIDSSFELVNILPGRQYQVTYRAVNLHVGVIKITYSNRCVEGRHMSDHLTAIEEFPALS